MSAIDERRAQFQRYKEDVKRRGKPFYPYAMFHDTVMSLVVVSVIIGLAADWYFYFLFYLLRIFKWPDSVILGTVGIPTILLIIAFALPFVDVRRERRLLRRPVAVVGAVLVVVSMGVLTYKGAVAKEALASEVRAAVPGWAEREGFQDNKQAVAGANVFADSASTACHTYLGTGTSNAGAPDLSSIGKGGRGVEGFATYVSDPSKFGNTVMPKFGSLADLKAEGTGISQLRALAVFLDASKGPK